MALAFYGAAHDEAELRRLFRTRGMGTSPARVMITFNLPIYQSPTLTLIGGQLHD
jgi:hypothetical protein